MCDHCDWEDFIARAQGLLEDLDELPARAEGFAESVREKTEGMIGWASENSHVTPRMDQSLDNMQDGVDKWLKR